MFPGSFFAQVRFYIFRCKQLCFTELAVEGKVRIILMNKKISSFCNGANKAEGLFFNFIIIVRIWGQLGWATFIVTKA